MNCSKPSYSFKYKEAGFNLQIGNRRYAYLKEKITLRDVINDVEIYLNQPKLTSCL